MNANSAEQLDSKNTNSAERAVKHAAEKAAEQVSPNNTGSAESTEGAGSVENTGSACQISPKVSVVIPAYNSQRYLRQCLDSALSQTLSDIEVICVNDGSTDDTLTIMREYAARDSRVRIIDKENAGYGAGVNDGFAAAKGEYVAILESDDYVQPTMYETYYKTACENGKPDLVRGNWFKFMGEEPHQKRILRQPTMVKAWYGHVFDPSKDPMTLRLFAINQPGIYRRSFIVENNIRLNESPGASYQDNGLFFQLMCLAHSCILLEERLYMLRRDNPNSSFYAKDKVFTICDEYDFVHDFMKSHPEFGHERLELAAARRFRSYVWTMNRLDPKLRPMFAERFHDDFAALDAAGELSRERFTAQDWGVLQVLLSSPYLYFLLHRQNRIARKKQLEKEDLKHGKEYRVGHKLLKLPRLILGRPEGGTGKSSNEEPVSDFVRPKGFVGAPIDWRLVPENIPESLRSWYISKSCEELDFEDAQTYGQKIQWLKMFDATPEKTLLTDKYLARDWVTERIGTDHLIPLIAAYDTADEVDFSVLPTSFVLKTNHGSGAVCIVKDVSMLDRAKVLGDMSRSLKMNYMLHYGYEIHYMNIPPKILVEENIAPEQGITAEYKFTCFNGKPHSIWCTTGIAEGGQRFRNSYDLDWNLLPEVALWPNVEKPIPRPKNLDEMADIATKLSQGFTHVRVDLFSVEDKIYFGEMTFTPTSGMVTFDPPEARWEYGRLIELPEERNTALLEQIAAWRSEALGQQVRAFELRACIRG